MIGCLLLVLRFDFCLYCLFVCFGFRFWLFIDCWWFCYLVIWFVRQGVVLNLLFSILSVVFDIGC